RSLKIENLRMEIAAPISSLTRIHIPNDFTVIAAGMLDRVGIDTYHDICGGPTGLQLLEQSQLPIEERPQHRNPPDRGCNPLSKLIDQCLPSRTLRQHGRRAHVSSRGNQRADETANCQRRLQQRLRSLAAFQLDPLT